MSFKPNDFFLGLQDFLIILVPGGVFVLFIYSNDTSIDFVDVNKFLETFKAFPDLKIALLIFASYVIGHLVNRFSSYLDVFYDLVISYKNDTLISRIKKLRGKKRDKSLSNFEWAKFHLYNTDSKCIQEAESKMINSKFFRSLVVVLIPIIPFQTNLKIILLLVLLMWFSFYQFLILRKESVAMIYKHTIYSLDRESD